MVGLKRKPIFERMQTRSRTKKCKVVEDKVDTEQKKSDLKIIFSRVRKRSEDEPSIYKIKNANEVLNNSETQIRTTNKDTYESMNSTSIHSQIPDFADLADLEDIFNITDLREFIENNNIDDAADILASSSTPDYPMAVADVINNPEKILHNENLSAPVDLTTKETRLNDSEPSKFIPFDSLSARIEAYINNIEHEIPTVQPTCNEINKPKTPTVDRKSSSPTNCATTPITKNKNNVYTEKRRAIRPEPRKLLKSPSMVLEEIINMQGMEPNYAELPSNQNSNSMVQYRVWFNNHNGAINAYGTGRSTKDAKNFAASSLLDKLVSNKYFGNIIGQLQEFCIARKWPPPKYVDEMEVRSKNGSTFIVSCSVKQQREFGQGKSKKMAKLFAAYKMLLNLTTK